MNSSVDTVNAAAAAIVSAEARVQPVAAVPRRKWAACLGVYWCFRPHKNGKRISHAVLVPEPSTQRSVAPAADTQILHAPLVLPFIAPPSSPSSFLQSETGSMIHSPVGPPSFSANSMSPTGPASGFTVGPYAHETQLVSPPVFSAFTTEPSTAPFTPPPESVHLTTPSSPEVPYAKLLASITSKCGDAEAGVVQSYQLDPGSPIGRLISPSSVCSGTSSPFQEPECQSDVRSSFISFPVCEPPKLLDGEAVSSQKLVPHHTRNGGSLLDGLITAAVPHVDFSVRLHHSEHSMDQRVSFELSAEDVARRLEKKAAISRDSAEASLARDSSDARAGICVDESYHDLPEKARRSLSLRLAKEFKFENLNGISTEPIVDSDWWANEKATAAAAEPRKSWSFFPMAQS